MNHLMRSKVFAIGFAEAILDNASLTTAEIDTQGFDWCSIYLRVGTTDIAMTALKLQESDTSGSGFTDVTGTVWGTATDIDGNTTALPSATDDDTFQVMHVNLRGRKRYLDLVATAGNGTAGSWLFAFAILHDAAAGPNSSAEMGAEHVVSL